MKLFFICLLGAGLLACSSSLKILPYNNQPINVQQANDVSMDSLCAPYSRSLAKEMNRIIATNLEELAPGRPNSLLGNYVTDLLMLYATDSLKITEPKVVLINAGGLRASLPQGNITVGDIFKVMPFDNQIVALKIEKEKLKGLIQYMTVSGGDPIAGFQLTKDSLIFPKELNTSSFVWVITSDFLANGGDKMSFLNSPLDRKDTKMIIRDYLLNYIEREKVIQVSKEKRVIW